MRDDFLSDMARAGAAGHVIGIALVLLFLVGYGAYRLLQSWGLL